MKSRTNLLASFIALLFFSHSVFGQQPVEQADMSIDAATRTEVITGLLKRINDSYVFPDVARKMEESIWDRVKKGEYDNITSAAEFAKKLTADLQAVSRDKHLRVRYSHRPVTMRVPGSEPTAEERENFQRFAKRMNHGFEKVERLPGNIGYIELRGFLDPDFGAETVAAAMNLVANTESLIIDLRQNGGGHPGMVALISSYLFGNEPVHLNSLYWREGDRMEHFWTKAQVVGKRYEGKDVYVLTSNYTFSGAEEFSYNLKNLKRAQIVGETTGGGAHPGGNFRITEHFGAFVPTGRAINPITKTNWEGTGVKPDIAVPKELALKTAYLAALNRSAEKVTEENLKGEYRRLIEKTQKELDELKKTSKAGQ